MTYDEAMETYGTDQPDLRVKGELKIANITDSVIGSDFKVFIRPTLVSTFTRTPVRRIQHRQIRF